jgi:hypothetical protein
VVQVIPGERRAAKPKRRASRQWNAAPSSPVSRPAARVSIGTCRTYAEALGAVEQVTALLDERGRLVQSMIAAVPPRIWTAGV